MQDAKLRLVQLDGVLCVEKTRHFTNLLQISISEGLLDNDVDQVLGHRIVLVLELAFKLNDALGGFIDANLVLCPSHRTLKKDIFV